jgi:hypothetical protein
VLILLTTEPSRLLETILSRCQRVSFGVRPFRVSPEVNHWITDFARKAAPGSTGVLARYQLLGTLLESLAAARESIEEQLTSTSPLAKYPDATPAQKEQWEDALTAAIEAEYRRRRGEYLAGLQAWLRDVWLRVCGGADDASFFPTLASATEAVAARLKLEQAQNNLESWEGTQRLLHTNVQEALALEVGLLRLSL